MVSHATEGINMSMAVVGAADYSLAIKDLSLSQAQLLLSLQNVDAEQQRYLLLQAGLISSSDKMMAKHVSEALSVTSLDAAEKNRILTSAGLMDRKTKELLLSNSCTEAKLRELLGTTTLDTKEKEAIITKILGTTTNGTYALSFDVLTKAIWKNIVAMAKWLVTNPVGWAILGAGAVFTLVKAIDLFTESTEEAAETAHKAKEDYNAISSNIENLNSKIKENNKLIAETNGVAEYDGYRKRLEAENDELQRQIYLEKIKAQEAKSEADRGATKTLTDETYEYDVNRKYSRGAGKYLTTQSYGSIETATDWYLDQAETTGVVDDRLKNYIETIKEQRENLDLLNPKSKELYDRLGLLVDRYIALYPEIKTTSEEMGNSADDTDKATTSLSDLKKASDNISSLSSAFKELSDDGYITTETISKIQEATELSGDEWKEYENKLLTAKKGSSEFNQVLSDLTYKILENTFGTEGLANATEEQIAAVLRENGVTNASAVAHQVSARAKYEEYLQTIDLNNVTAEETNELIRLAQQCGITQQQIGFLTTAMEVLANTDLNLADKSAQLLQMAASAGIAMVAVGEASSILADMQSGSAGALRRQEASGKSMTDLYKASIQEILVYFGGLGNQISGISPKYTGGGSKGGGSSKSDFDDSYYSIIDALIEDGEKEIDKLEKDRETLNRQFENALDSGNKEQAEILRAKLAENAKAQKDILHNQNESYRVKRSELLQSLYQYAPSLSGKAWDEISEVDLINIENELNKKSETSSDNDKNQAKYNLNQFKGIVDDLKAINDVIEENSNAWWEADEAQKEYWQSLIDFQDDYSNTWIDNQKAFDKLSEEEELKAYGRMINNNKEFQKQILNDMTLSAEAKLELVKETNDKIVEIEKEAYDLRKQIATDRLEHNSSQIGSLKTLLQAYYDVRNAVTDAQHEISKELAASKVMYEYLNEETRKLLFNQEDYNTLNEKLIDIQAEAEKLQSRYNQDILSATEENLEQITSQYEMQFDLLMKSYEISKAELEVAKKKQQLNNVLNERNVRMFINGQWQWVANTQDVINAQNELADAEYEAKQSKLDLQQTEAMNRLTQAEDMLTTAINEIENGVKSLGNSLSTVYSEHVPALGEICDEAANTIRNFANGLTGSDSSASLKSSGYDNGGKKISFDPNVDYSALMAYYTPGSRQWERLNERRNAKIDALGLSYTKYATGTRSTKSGNALMGEDGFEAFINNNGHLIPINQPTLFTGIGAGGTVFNTEQMANLRSLWDLSNVGTANYGSLVNRTVSQTSGDVNCNNITINGMTVDSGSADGQALINSLRRYVGNH